MRFDREQYSLDLVQEMVPLWKAHYEEIAHYKDIELDPDLTVYESCATQGSLRIFTARDAENELVGYQVFFMRANPHYRKSIQAVSDILFLAEACRKGLTGYRFVRWCGDQLRAEGTQVIYQHVKAKHDFGQMLERMGYDLQERIYSMRLD